MINYTETTNHICLYLNEAEKNYHDMRFPLVSKWVLHLATTKSLEDDFLAEFSELIKEKCPTSKIDWEKTFKAVDVHKEYMTLISPLYKNDKVQVIKATDERIADKVKIIEELKRKHGL
jgi:hypothetical protein